MSYKRVIPRDLFNESNLLFSLARLSLLILEKQVNGLPLKEEYDGKPFKIVQDDSDGRLSCSNYKVFLDGEEIFLSRSYNDKTRCNLYGIYKGNEYYIFNDSGHLMPNFGRELYKKS